MITYDAYNRLDAISDGSGTHDFAYYLNSSIKSVDGPWPDDTITYTYDRLDRVASISAQGSPAVSYAYDTLNRLTSITSGDQTHTYGYTGVNPLVQSLTRPNGSTTAYSYNTINQLSEIANRTGAGTLIDRYAYTHDSRDMIANETVETAQALSALAESLQTYDYNQVNQLLSKTNPSQSLSYDADGNVIQGYTPGGDVFYADYDAENRLKSIEYSDSQSGQHHRLAFSYYYNDFLARVRTYVDQAQVADLRIVRSGYLPLQDRDGSNSVQKSYTWGLNLGGGIGGLLAVTDAGQHYQYLYDGKGNVSAVLDASAQPVASYRYDAFGKLLSKSGSFEQPFMFSTKRYFQGVGLSYYGYRFYQPVMGRWLTRDPLQEAGGINLYGFVQNNPVNYFDPFGLKDFSECETQLFLAQARDQNLFEAIYNHRGGGKFDFLINQPTDTFAVQGRRFNAGQFGNFLAGYSGAHLAGFAGYVGVIAGGQLFDALDFGRDKVFNFDRQSIPYINDGAALGQAEVDNGKPYDFCNRPKVHRCGGNE